MKLPSQLTRIDFVALAQAEVGVMEITANRSPRILEYRDATTLGRNGTSDAGWAWCSAFVCWCMREHIKAARLAIIPFRSARANDWETWAHPGVTVLDAKKYTARAGDIVTFEFDGDAQAEHVGIVAADQASLGADFRTIEGNTSGTSASRDGAKGEGVFNRVRKASLARKYVRWLQR